MVQADADLVWSEFKAIEKDAEKRFAKGWQRAAAIFKEELSVIEHDEPPIEAFAEDIPY